MQTGDKGLRLLKFSEGFRSQLYNDVTKNATIGYGHLVHHDPVDGSEAQVFKDGISEACGEQLLRGDLSRAENAINEMVEVSLSQDQFDALADFIYNLGVANFGTSTLLVKLNALDYDGAADQLLRWNKAGGTVVDGLEARRQAERNLFLYGTLPGGA